MPHDFFKHLNFGEKNLSKLIEFINQPSETFIRCDIESNSMDKNIRLLEADGIKSEIYSNKFLKILSNEGKILSSTNPITWMVAVMVNVDYQIFILICFLKT